MSVGMLWDQLIITDGQPRPTGSPFGGLADYARARETGEGAYGGQLFPRAASAGSVGITATQGVPDETAQLYRDYMGAVVSEPQDIAGLPTGLGPRQGNYGGMYAASPGVFGMGSIVSQFFGRDQAWYTRVTKAEDAILLLDNKLFAIGQAAWDAVREALGGKLGNITILPFSTIKALVLENVKTMIGADRETLAESKLSAVEAAVSVYTPQVDTVIKASPTPTQANVATEQYNLTKTLANLPKYGSPSEVARRVFVEDLSERAGAALGIGVVAAIAAGVIALWVLRK